MRNKTQQMNQTIILEEKTPDLSFIWQVVDSELVLEVRGEEDVLLREPVLHTQDLALPLLSLSSALLQTTDSLPCLESQEVTIRDNERLLTCRDRPDHLLDNFSVSA